MSYYINNFQLRRLFELISAKYQTFAPEERDGKVVFNLIDNFSDLRLFSETIIPFKKILFPNGISKDQTYSSSVAPLSRGVARSSLPAELNNKIALLGLRICDVHALDIFLKQFAGLDLILKRNQIFIMAVSCKPDDDCFCDVFGADKISGFDLYLQKEDERFSIFTDSAAGIKILDKLALKSPKNPPQIYPLYPFNHLNPLQKDRLTKSVENRQFFSEFWQGISNNCFGCGACTAVCPLCFCIRQDYKNNLDNESEECLAWDSCFADDFFKISGGFDFKPKNVDRLYNWYHHKFVRGPKEIREFLCVGCGRCIKACPAHLNIKNILQSLEEKGAENNLST